MQQKDKYIFFYASSNNNLSGNLFLQELNKNDILKMQVMCIDVSNNKINIPKKIKDIGKYPILIINGINDPIIDGACIDWLKSSPFYTNHNAMLASSADTNYASLLDNSRKNPQNEYNTGYGMLNGDNFATNYCKINDSRDTTITTYGDDNNSERKSAKKDELERKMQLLEKSRNELMPRVPMMARTSMPTMPTRQFNK